MFCGQGMFLWWSGNVLWSGNVPNVLRSVIRYFHGFPFIWQLEAFFLTVHSLDGIVIWLPELPLLLLSPSPSPRSFLYMF